MKTYKKIYTLHNISELDNSTIDLFNKFTSNKEIENELIYKDLKKYVKCSTNNVTENNTQIVEYIFLVDTLDNDYLNKIDLIINNPRYQNNFATLLKYIKETDKEYISFKEEILN